MEILVIIGLLLICIGFVLALFSDIDSDKLTQKIMAFILLYVGLVMFIIGAVMETYKDALNSNPYTKEYLYKQTPSGVMEKHDSIYVRIKKAK